MVSRRKNAGVEQDSRVDPRRRPEFQFDSDKSECNIVKAEGSFLVVARRKNVSEPRFPCWNEDSPEIPILCDQDANQTHLFHRKI